MRKAFRVSDFRKLTEPEKREALATLARDSMATPNGEVKLVEAEIRKFERRYEMPSDRMRELMARGDFQETADVAEWLIALDVMRRLRGEARAE